MVTYTDDKLPEGSALQALPVAEDEQPMLPADFFGALLGRRECGLPEACTNCGRCEY